MNKIKTFLYFLFAKYSPAYSILNPQNKINEAFKQISNLPIINKCFFEADFVCEASEAGKKGPSTPPGPQDPSLTPPGSQEASSLELDSNRLEPGVDSRIDPGGDVLRGEGAGDSTSVRSSLSSSRYVQINTKHEE